jgi:DNA-binding NtrC family response regulator
MNTALLVDDDPSIIRFLKRVLRSRFGTSIEVHDSHDFADARRQLAESPFDVLITDIYLQGENGLDLVVAAKDGNPCLQVIAMTGIATVELIRYAATCGVSDFCLKPLRSAEIASRLAEAIERAERWRMAIGGTVCEQLA